MVKSIRWDRIEAQFWVLGTPIIINFTYVHTYGSIEDAVCCMLYQIINKPKKAIGKSIFFSSFLNSQLLNISIVRIDRCARHCYYYYHQCYHDMVMMAMMMMMISHYIYR